MAAYGSYGPQSSGSSPDPIIFGVGLDGDLNITSGVTVLSKDFQARNVVISGTGQLNLSGYKLKVSGKLDLSNAPLAAIFSAGSTPSTYPPVSGSASGATGGTLLNLAAANTMPTSQIGASGPNGTTGVGAAGTAALANGYVPLTLVAPIGSVGGAGTPNAGGSAAAALTTNRTPGFSALLGGFDQSPTVFQLVATPTTVGKAGAGGNAGAAGGGDGTNSGGGGGAGGHGLNWIVIAAYNIVRGASTAVGAIYAAGMKGGNGGTPPAGNCGGGGGGSGGSGGNVWIIAQNLLGTAATGAIEVSGGAGGNGGNGIGTGLGGGGGPGGATGFVQITNIGALTSASSPSSATPGSAATTTVTITGATGAAGATLQVNL